jgi:hypothetical protein
VCHWFRPVRVRPGFRKDSLRLLFATGWRLWLTSYLLQFSVSFPRWALASLGGALLFWNGGHLQGEGILILGLLVQMSWIGSDLRGVSGGMGLCATCGGAILLASQAAGEGQSLLLMGLFMPVSWMITGMSGVAASVSSYLYPTLTYRYAKEGIPVGRVAWRLAVKVTLGLAPLAAAGLALMPFLLRLLRAEYLRSLWAVEVAIVSGLVDCLTVATVAFAAAKAWRPLYAFVACALIARSAGAFVGYHVLSDRLLGVALGMLAASTAMGVATWWTVRRAGAPVAERPEVTGP